MSNRFFSLFFFPLEERESARESEKRKAKKNFHQIAIRRVLRRVTFRNRHIYTRVVDSYQTLTYSFELSYDVNV
jgi:hypothetical protein